MVDLCEVAPSNGLMEKRGGALIDIDRDALEARIRDYFDPVLPWEEYKVQQTALTDDAARFVAKDARTKATRAESFDPERCAAIPYGPLKPVGAITRRYGPSGMNRTDPLATMF